MKRKLKQMLAFILMLAVALPVAVFANPMDAVPRQEVSGEYFVPLRAVADAHGVTLERDGEAGTVTLTFSETDVWTFNLLELVDALNGFIESGRTWIPLEYAEMIFDRVPQMPIPELETLTFTINEEARDIVLADFEYLIDFILDNTPWGSLLNRALGIDLAELAGLYIEVIEAMEELTFYFLAEFMDLVRMQIPLREGDDARTQAANYLFALLGMDMAAHLMGIGHLGPRTLDIYTAQLTSFVRAYHQADPDEYNEYLAFFYNAFTHPSAVWFYGEVDVDLDADDAVLPAVPDNVQTVVVVPGEVAYLRINSFMVDMEYDDAKILPFLQEVSDFDHLIVDIRGNWGGLMAYPLQVVMRRLINEPQEVSSREFFSGGDVAVAMMDIMLQTILESQDAADELGYQQVLDAAIVPIGEFLAANDMPYFNASDLAQLDYVITARSVITPCEDAVGFNGTVWLLVDGSSASASAMLAELALYTGFATVVGENTSRIMGSSHVYIALPVTGIIWRADIGYQTDAYGRSLEFYGITPNIRNFDGMDALETVLALIATQAAE
jgi:hypothetical protein